MNEPITIYRIQDVNGRGPWKPGFSVQWLDARSESEWEQRGKELPSFFHEFGLGVLAKQIAGTHIGSGCRSLECLRLWFTRSEYDRLKYHGYQCVRMEADRILAESRVQCVFERIKPHNEDVEIIELYEKEKSKTIRNRPADNP